MPAERWLNISYEDFVRGPEREPSRVLDFADIAAEGGPPWVTRRSVGWSRWSRAR